MMDATTVQDNLFGYAYYNMSNYRDLVISNPDSSLPQVKYTRWTQPMWQYMVYYCRQIIKTQGLKGD